MTGPKQVRTVHPACSAQCNHEGAVPVFPGPIITMGPDPHDWADLQERANAAMAVATDGFEIPPVWVGSGSAPFDKAVLARNVDLEAQPFPAPRVTSDDDTMPDPIKAPVKALADKAKTMGWAVRITYAEGNYPHATTGRPSALKASYAVRTRYGAHGAVAVYTGGSSWSWDFMYAWAPDLPWTKYKTLDAFLDGIATVTARAMVAPRLLALGMVAVP